MKRRITTSGPSRATSKNSESDEASATFVRSLALDSAVCHSGDMTHLLVIHHSPTHSVQQLLEAALRGANHPDIEGVQVTSRPALAWARDEEDKAIFNRQMATCS